MIKFNALRYRASECFESHPHLPVSSAEYQSNGRDRKDLGQLSAAGSPRARSNGSTRRLRTRRQQNPARGAASGQPARMWHGLPQPCTQAPAARQTIRFTSPFSKAPSPPDPRGHVPEPPPHPAKHTPRAPILIPYGSAPPELHTTVVRVSAGDRGAQREHTHTQTWRRAAANERTNPRRHDTNKSDAWARTPTAACAVVPRRHRRRSATCCGARAGCSGAPAAARRAPLTSSSSR